jgi:hypothetical protein
MKKVTLALAATSVLSLVASTLVGRATPPGSCTRARSTIALRGPGSSAARGRGLGVAVDGGLQTISADGPTLLFDKPPGAGPSDVVRHVASAPALGTAYVLDRRGSDTLVIETPGGTLELPQRGEALHPAWSPRGDLVWSMGSSLVLRSGEDASISEIPPPFPGAFLFSPTFPTSGRIVTVVSAGPSEAVPEDEALDNLWAFDLTRGRWSALTDFGVPTADRWSVIRTPVVAHPGVVEFVRIQGSASASGTPSFSLWRLVGSSATRIATLSDERYLAGSDGKMRVWNVPDRTSGRWRIEREDAHGRRTDVGCGAVMVDPLDVLDPDKGSAAEKSPVAIPGSAPYVPATTDVEKDPEVAILVGDFSTPEEAGQAVDDIKETYGPRTAVDVVDSTTAVGVVQPGAWAALLALPDGADPAPALEDLRIRLPKYEDSSWVVTP